MSASHCRNKSLFNNVLKQNYVTSFVPVGKRSVSNSTNVATLQKVIDYNRLLKTQALLFRKNTKGYLDADKILQEMKTKGLEPNSQSYLQLVMGLATQQNRSKEQDEKLEYWFHNLLNLELKKGKKRSTVDKMNKILIYLSLYGHPNLKDMFMKIISTYSLDATCWHMAMKGCIGSGKIKDAEELLNLARKENLATASCYEILIKTFLSSKDLKSASKIFSFMLNDNVTANHQIYNLFINHYMGLPFTPGNMETLDKLLQAVVMTTTEKTIPDDTAEKLIRYYSKHKKYTRAEQLYLDLKSRNGPSPKVLHSMDKVIIGFANKKHLPSALSLYYDMLAQGYKPSNEVVLEIMEALEAQKDIEAIQQLMDITVEFDPTLKQIFNKIDR